MAEVHRRGPDGEGSGARPRASHPPARDRIGPHQLVLDGDERDRDAGQRARPSDPRSPRRSARARTRSGRGRSRTPCTRPSRMSNPVTVTPPSNVTPASRRLPRERRHDPHRLRDAVARHEVRRRGSRSGRAAGSARRPRPGRAGRCPRSRTTGRTPAAASAPHALRRGRDLDAADPVPARLAVELERRRRARTVSCAIRHIVREPFVWKTRPGRVRGGAAGLEQRALVDHQDVGRRRAPPGGRRRSRRRCPRRR